MFRCWSRKALALRFPIAPASIMIKTMLSTMTAVSSGLTTIIITKTETTLMMLEKSCGTLWLIMSRSVSVSLVNRDIRSPCVRLSKKRSGSFSSLRNKSVRMRKSVRVDMCSISRALIHEEKAPSAKMHAMNTISRRNGKKSEAPSCSPACARRQSGRM